MVYITRKHGNDVNSFPNEVKHLWEKLLADCDSLCSEVQILP